MAALALLLSATAARAELAAPEYQLKAVFVLNFARFVAWPPPAFPSPHAPFVIGVLGPDPFGSYLDDAVQGQRIDGHPLVVRRFRSLGGITACRILFIAGPSAADLRRVFARLRGCSVLTVGDAPGFGRRGGMIAFVTRHRRIGLRIDVEAARAAR
ncbi:MAG: YfiR family protein, partial [Opitutaceae bacterium]